MPKNRPSWLAWVRQTPERSLDAASQANQAMNQIVEDAALLQEEGGGNTVRWYLEQELLSYARTARVRLLECRLSAALLGGAAVREELARLEVDTRALVTRALVLLERRDPAPDRAGGLAFEKTGLVPRSIPRTLDRVRRELFPSAEEMVVQEFRVSRYQTLASMRLLVGLLCVPWAVAWGARAWLLQPAATAVWNTSHHELFLHTTQEERAFGEMQAFQEKLYFEVLVGEAPDPRPAAIQARMDAKAHDLADAYNQNSIDSITNLLSDGVAVGTLVALLTLAKPQIAVLKSFLDELVYSLSDATKAFLIILSTDILVGFHSPHGWEVLLELLLAHLGLPESKDFIFLFVATFPVILDTVLKYWIFRYLNQISPSAVATYHNMNE